MIMRFIAVPAVMLAAAVTLSPGWAQTQTQQQVRPGTSAAPSAAAAQLGPGQYLARKNLIGMAVYDPNNRQVGDIEDLVVERNGQVSYAIIARGGVLGVGEKHVAVPLSQLAIDDTGKRVHVNLSRDQLAQAPRFDYDRASSAARSGSTTAPPSTGTATPGAGTGATAAPSTTSPSRRY
jgi:sporulation protein YlmC with PRC-barrel domain